MKKILLITVVLAAFCENSNAQGARKKSENIQDVPAAINAHLIYTTKATANKGCRSGYTDCSWLQQGQVLYCCNATTE